MVTNHSLGAYRTASASGATHIGLLLLVYDALASDFRKASDALSRGDIGGRCTYSNHALLLLGHLQEWCAFLDDEPLAMSLTTFYGHLRVMLLQYQKNGTPKDFSGLAGMVTETRAVWQLKEQQANESRQLLIASEAPIHNMSRIDEELKASSWSA